MTNSLPLKTLTNCLFLLCCLPLAAFSQAVRPKTDVALQRMERELERIAKLGGGAVGMQAVHLESGQTISLNPQLNNYGLEVHRFKSE